MKKEADYVADMYDSEGNLVQIGGGGYIDGPDKTPPEWLLKTPLKEWTIDQWRQYESEWYPHFESPVLADPDSYKPENLPEWWDSVRVLPYYKPMELWTREDLSVVNAARDTDKDVPLHRLPEGYLSKRPDWWGTPDVSENESSEDGSVEEEPVEGVEEDEV